MWYHPNSLSNPDLMANSNFATKLKPSQATALANVAIKPLNLQGGQCTWCGKYGHKRKVCPLL
ncbi:hypothetical protein BD560DRAFT_407190, partial [Blakeslea trispora]